MINGVTFGGDGPVMKGTWYNPATGDSFTVRDAFFENDRYVVYTEDGRMLDFSQIQHYVQSDKPIDMKKQDTQAPIPQEVANLIADDTEILREDLDLISKSLGNLAQPVQTLATQPTPMSNRSIIEKALSKRELPDVNVSINWFLFPSNEIKMLMELMDVTFDEIIDWYVNQVDVAKLTSFVREAIKQHVNYMLSTPVEDVVSDEGGAFATEPKETPKPKTIRGRKPRTNKK